MHRAEDTVELPERHAGHALNQAQAVRRTVMPATPPIPFSSVDPLSKVKRVKLGPANARLAKPVLASGIRLARMERLWSPAGATSGNQRQIGRPPKPRKQAKSVAVGGDWLPRASNGKEGVDGSSPSEGFTKSLQMSDFFAILVVGFDDMRSHRVARHPILA
jgi:hypothetical protein